MENDIETKLWSYIRENCLPQGSEVSYTDDESLFDAGIMDSAGLISFICFIEEEYDLKIPDEDLLPHYFSSIASISAYIKARKSSSKETVWET